MTGERLFEGYDFPRWASVLTGAGHERVRWRPGGGFYTDRTPDLLLEKAHQIGRQTSLLPPDITGSVQAELENFPYQGLSKSRAVTFTECAADIAAGCTGIAYNILPSPRDGLSEVLPLVDALTERTPFLDLMADAFHGVRREGLFAGWSMDAMATANFETGAWLDGSSSDFSAAFPLELYQIGIPPAYASADACVTALRGDTVAVLHDDEIDTLFERGVYMDGRALAHICAAGREDLVGCTPGGRFDVDCIEMFSDHPLSGDMRGEKRDTRQSFWHEPAFGIIPGPDAETIASLIDYAGDEVASSTMIVFENSLGGRVCVSGYSPWTMLHSRAKAQQLQSVMRWLSKNTLGAYVATYHRVSIWYARSQGGTPVVVAVNCSMDPAVGVALNVTGTGGTGTAIDETLAETEIRSIGTDGPYQCYELPPIQPWKPVLIRF
jgi:hypothetical protein